MGETRMSISQINSGCASQLKSHINPQKNVSEKHQYSLRDSFDLPKGVTIVTPLPGISSIRKLSPEDLFDIQFHSGTKLSNGAVLIRPVILSLGTVDIRPVKNLDKVYIINQQSDELSSEKRTRYISEENLLKNRSLTRGAIKEIAKGRYNMVFLDKDGKKQNITGNKEECLTVLRDNFLYM